MKNTAKNNSKTIRVTCTGAATLPLEKLLPLQGELKTITPDRAAKLRASILRHGITFPFFVWRNGDKNFIIDAHQRDKVLQGLQTEGWTVPPVPVAWIEAADEKEAREKILLCNSQYGQMNESSLGAFITGSLLDISTLEAETAGLPLPLIDFTKPVLKEISIQPPPQDGLGADWNSDQSILQSPVAARPVAAGRDHPHHRQRL
jgi:hypothetical protein